MGKCSNIGITALKVLALMVLVLFLVLISGYIYTTSFKKGPSANMTEIDLRLTCFVCQALTNFPDSSKNTSQSYLPEDTECLRSPKYTQLCQRGEYCAVLHQKLNQIERVVRTCHKGEGKLGCNTDIINGIEEKTCFCTESYCCQIPFVGDGKKCFGFPFFGYKN